MCDYKNNLIIRLVRYISSRCVRITLTKQQYSHNIISIHMDDHLEECDKLKTILSSFYIFVNSSQIRDCALQMTTIYRVNL